MKNPFKGDFGDHLLWTASAGLDDIRKLMQDPHQWLEDVRKEHFEEYNASTETQIEFSDRNRDLILFFSYPYVKIINEKPVGESATKEKPWEAMIEGITKTNVLMVRVLQPDELLAGKAADGRDSDSFQPSGFIDVTLDEQNKLAYFHHQLGTDPKKVDEMVIDIIENPPAYFDHLNRKSLDPTTQRPTIKVSRVVKSATPAPAIRFNVIPDDHFEAFRLIFIAGNKPARRQRQVQGKDGGPSTATATTCMCTKATCTYKKDDEHNEARLLIANLAFYNYPPGTPGC